jgi:hypothetical protein
VNDYKTLADAVERGYQRGQQIQVQAQQKPVKPAVRVAAAELFKARKRGTR